MLSSLDRETALQIAYESGFVEPQEFNNTELSVDGQQLIQQVGEV